MYIKPFKEFINESSDSDNIQSDLNEANSNWVKTHATIVYDLEQVLDRCFKFEDDLVGKVTPAELAKAKKAHKKLEDAIRDIINSL